MGGGGDRASAMVARGFRLVRAETQGRVEPVGERSGGADFTCPDRLGSSGPCPGAVRRLRPWSGRRKNLGACAFRPRLLCGRRPLRRVLAGQAPLHVFRGPCRPATIGGCPVVLDRCYRISGFWVGLGWHDGGMSSSTAVDTHGGTIRMSIHEVARQLNAGLGPTLVAALTGARTGSCRSGGRMRMARSRARLSGAGCCWRIGCGR